MGKKTFKLNELSQAWQDKVKENEVNANVIPFNSKDPLVDGTAMTVNTDIKHRRKRTISKNKHYTKNSKIREFKALVNWLNGNGEPLEKPTALHLNILSLIRNGHEAPENYQAFIKDNYEDVQKAACVKPKEVKRLWKAYESSKTEKDKKNVQQTKPVKKDTTKYKGKTRQDKKNVIKAKERFKAWLNAWLGLSNDVITWSEMYALAFAHYVKHGTRLLCSSYSTSIREVLQEELYVEQLDKRTIGVSVARKQMTIDGHIITFGKTYAQQIIEDSIDSSNLDNNEASFDSLTINRSDSLKGYNEQAQFSLPPSKTYETADTLTLLIKLAKQAGATEVSIKL